MALLDIDTCNDGRDFMNFISAFLKDESGASAAEYALILALIGVAIATAMTGLGSAIAGAVNKAADCITGPSC